MDLVKIIDMAVFRYRLRLKRPLNLKGEDLRFREGFALRLTDDKGNYGWGEAAPLPGFSRENARQAAKELTTLPSSLCGHDLLPHAEMLSGGFEDWLSKLDLSASVRFGVESAVLNLQARSDQLSLHRLLDKNAAGMVIVNGLLSGNKDHIEKQTKALFEQEYQAFKLKVGRLPVDEDIDLIAGVRNIIGPNTLLRLDANRSWNVQDALNFMEHAVEFNIDYIEEPAQNLYQLKTLLNDRSASLPVALDESLLEISPRDLLQLPALKAIVIKPTLLGLDRALRFSRKAQDVGITPVISSAFESSLGLFTLASMAAGINGGQTPAGLDTLNWLADDILEPPLQIQAGKIILVDDSSLMENIKMDFLEELAR